MPALTTAEQISRLQTLRNTIRAQLNTFGLVASNATLDACATAITNIIYQGAVNASVKEGETYTIPAGFHNGSGVVAGVAGGGNYTLQEKTVTPTKSQQSIVSDSGYYGLSGVTVKAIPEAYQDVSSTTLPPEFALFGKIYVLADGTVTTGTMPNNGAVKKTLDTNTIKYTIPVGYHNGLGEITIVLEEQSVTPSKSEQTVTPEAGKVLKKVIIAPIPAAYQIVTGVTTVAGHVLAGDIFVDAEGNEVEGTMPNNGAVNQTLDIGTPSYTVPDGYTSGGKVQIVPEEKSVTPTKAAQTVTPASGKVISKVEVGKIPDKYQDVTPVTTVPANVLEGDVYVDATGAAKEGTMPNNEALNLAIDGLTITRVAIPMGFTSGGSVILTDDIALALSEI